MSDHEPLEAARSAYLVARQQAADALAPLADDGADVERLLELVAPDDLLWWNAQIAADAAADQEYIAWDLDPAHLWYFTATVVVEQRRQFHARVGDSSVDVAWDQFASAIRACVDAIGGTPERYRGHDIDLSPPQPAHRPAVTRAPAGKPSTGGSGSRDLAAARRVAGTVGAVVGVAVGLLAWPLLAAIAGTGPARPYGPIGSPLGTVELWWVWLVSVVGGGAAGWWLASEWSSTRR